MNSLSQHISPQKNKMIYAELKGERILHLLVRNTTRNQMRIDTRNARNQMPKSARNIFLEPSQIACNLQ